MIPTPELIEPSIDSSFTVREFTSPCDQSIFHFHEEYELTYVINASGERFIGGKLEAFSSGDLVLIGKDTPHYYIHDEKTQKQEEAPVVVIHFTQDFLGKHLQEYPEMKSFAKLLEHANSGICFSEDIVRKVEPLLLNLNRAQVLNRLIYLLQIFSYLITDNNYRVIGNLNIETCNSQKDQHRINTIYSQVATRYNEKLSIAEMATFIHMTPQAFCRFFKRITRQSFIEFLNEYRIGKSCQMIRESEMPISEIAFVCGFTNQANFNRKFKEQLKMTPRNYRDKMK
jgi:AraC-like DNA-binding protein